MDLTSLNTLLPASAGILFFIQSCYHLGLYRNLYLHSRKEKQETDTPPLSVILVAKDAASDLQKNLPAILEQDYPDFEVIVIYDQSSDDDCEDVLKLLENKYPHLHKSLYYEQKGFTSHLNLQRGEDDLFINQVANGKNTRVEASPESIVRITTPHYKKDWYEDKLSYHLTSRLYKGFSRYLMGFETCTRLLFLLLVIVCIVYGILTQSWIVLGTAIMLWLLRYLMQVMVFRKTSIALGERKFYSTLLMFDWMQPLWNFRLKLSQRFSRKDEFMRR